MFENTLSKKPAYISTINMSEADWLELRKSGIGGSDVAAICGLSKYKTPLDVYMDKLGLVPPFDGNKSTEAGKRLEPLVADWYADVSGNKVINDNKMRFHKDYPFLFANVDRLILPNSEHTGRGILECKTSSTFMTKVWDENPPAEYILQLQHYLDVLDLDWGEFAVLLGNNDFRRYYIQRDNELIKDKNIILSKFWLEHIEKRVKPEPIKSSDIEKFYGRIYGKSIEVVEEVAKTVNELRELKRRIKELESEEDQLSERIKLVMGDAECITHQGDVLATYKYAEDSIKFDSKTLKSEQPTIYDMYSETVPGSRRFIVKG